MKVTPRKIIRKDTNVLSELKDGFSYAFGFIPIRYIIFLLGLISLMGMQYTVLMPVFCQRDFTRRFSYFRIFDGSIRFGCLSGALYLASRKNTMGLVKVIPWPHVYSALVLLHFFSKFFLLSLVLMVITGLE